MFFQLDFLNSLYQAFTLFLASCNKMSKDVPQQTLVPALDDLASAKCEHKWLIATHTAVKLCTIFQLALERGEIVLTVRQIHLPVK